MLLKSPMTLFVYSILSKWYITIFVTAIVVTFWVFKGLNEAGVLHNAQVVVFDVLKQTKSIAQYCVPKITNLSNFWSCIESPPEYNPSEEEKTLEEAITKTFSPALDYKKMKDPYSEGE